MESRPHIYPVRTSQWADGIEPSKWELGPKLEANQEEGSAKHDQASPKHALTEHDEGQSSPKVLSSEQGKSPNTTCDESWQDQALQETRLYKYIQERVQESWMDLFGLRSFKERNVQGGLEVTCGPSNIQAQGMDKEPYLAETTLLMEESKTNWASKAHHYMAPKVLGESTLLKEGKTTKSPSKEEDLTEAPNMEGEDCMDGPLTLKGRLFAAPCDIKGSLHVNQGDKLQEGSLVAEYKVTKEGITSELGNLIPSDMAGHIDGRFSHDLGNYLPKTLAKSKANKERSKLPRETPS